MKVFVHFHSRYGTLSFQLEMPFSNATIQKLEHHRLHPRSLYTVRGRKGAFRVMCVSRMHGNLHYTLFRAVPLH